MDYKYITDMNHLVSDDPKVEVPDEVLEFRDYLGHLISAATATTDAELLSAIPCRKKVNRKMCSGFVKVKRQDLPESYIFWHCSVCDDGGRIANWRDCSYDHSRLKPPVATNEPNPPVEVKISREEMNAILQGSIFDPDCDRIIYSARPAKTAVLFRGLYWDMDNFEGFLAAEANHEENKKRQRLLDSVHERISDAVQRVYEENNLGAD